VAQITGGAVKFGRTVKTGDYENKRGDIELSFNVGEGESETDIVTHATTLAQIKLANLLGLEVSGTAPVQEPKDRPRPGRPPGSGAKPPAQPADPAEVVPEPAAKASTTVAAALIAATAADPAAVADDLMTGIAPEITDKSLAQAIADHNEKIQNTLAIRNLIGAYGVGRATEIPQAKRSAFLTELRAIKAPGS
jgi:hypothetical protein